MGILGFHVINFIIYLWNDFNAEELILHKFRLIENWNIATIIKNFPTIVSRIYDSDTLNINIFVSNDFYQYFIILLKKIKCIHKFMEFYKLSTNSIKCNVSNFMVYILCFYVILCLCLFVVSGFPVNYAFSA